MGADKRAEQETPRDFKHLAIHVLVEMGFLVFSNIAAKDAVDLVVAMPKNGRLVTAGVRIKTSSRLPSRNKEAWYFSEDRARFPVTKTPFFYIFCLEREEKAKGALISEPIFIVISSTDLKRKTKTFRNGNYAIEISRKQVRETGAWAKFTGSQAFEQIREALQNAS